MPVAVCARSVPGAFGSVRVKVQGFQFRPKVSMALLSQTVTVL